MKKFLFLLFLIPTLSFAGPVDVIADQTLVELQALSKSWKTIKDPASAKKSAAFTKLQSTKLVTLAKELQKLERPSNEERTAIHKRREKAIEKLGDDIIKTLGMLRGNPSSMAILAKALEDIKKDMDASQKVFNLYFEPDSVTPKQP